MEENKVYKFLGDLFEKLRNEEGISICQLAQAAHIGTSKYEELKKGALSASASS